MLLISEINSVAPARSSAVDLQGLMAAELDEHADAYFLANRLEDSYLNLKYFSGIMSPLIVAAGSMLGMLVDISSLIAIGTGVTTGVLGALGLNLAVFRQGRRAKRSRDRYENLDVELLLCESEIKGYLNHE